MAKKLPKGMYQRGKVYYSCVSGVDGRMVRTRLSEDLDTAKTILLHMRHTIDLQKAGVIEAPPVAYAKNLEEIRREYVEHLRSGTVSENTIEAFGTAWAQVIHKNSFVYLSDLTLKKIEAWARRRLEEGSIRGQTINLYVGHIYRALSWAVSARRLQENPLAQWQAVRQNEPQYRRDLSPEEVGAILRAEDNFEWRVRWCVYLYTGLRKTTGTQLVWEWLDWDRRVLHIPTEFNKSRRPLELPLHDSFYDILKVWHDRKGNPVSGPLFSTVRLRQINQRLRRVCQTAGVESAGVTPHSFRHTFATTVYEGTGKDVKAVQVLLGHASASTTLRYLHLSLEDKKLAINSLDYKIEGL